MLLSTLFLISTLDLTLLAFTFLILLFFTYSHLLGFYDVSPLNFSASLPQQLAALNYLPLGQFICQVNSFLWVSSICFTTPQILQFYNNNLPFFPFFFLLNNVLTFIIFLIDLLSIPITSQV